MRVTGDVRRDPEQDLLAHAELARDRLQALQLVVGIKHDVTDTGPQRLAQLGRRLGVAVQVGPRRVKAATQRQRQLSAGGDVACQALLREHSVDGGARERLGGEQDVEVGVAAGDRVDEGARPCAQVVLDDHVGGGAEPLGELDRVTATEFEVARGVDARALREQVRQRRLQAGAHGTEKDMVWRVRAGSRRTITPERPAKTGSHDGLSYALWMPDTPPSAGVVVLHGAGSCKENHYDFARAVNAVGLAALTFDQRGHGASGGALDGRAVQDVVDVCERLRAELGDPEAPVALRGSSMGGYLALHAAGPAGAAAVIAICPASADGLLRGLHGGRFAFEADEPSLAALLEGGDLHQVVDSLEIPILLLHAQGDEQVPVQLSRELAGLLRSPASRLIEVPGGHHRSIQHDDELQAVSLRFLSRELSPS